MLLDGVRAGGVEGASLLDVGGGVGAIQQALLAEGAASATDVDASPAYLETAREEAERLGTAHRIDFRLGDFVDQAEDVAAHDIVTLDRVICCYPDMEALVKLSAERARRTVGLVFPRDRWWVRLGLRLPNLFFRVTRNPFRVFVHPTAVVHRLIEGAGHRRTFHRRTFLWEVAVYRRVQP